MNRPTDHPTKPVTMTVRRACEYTGLGKTTIYAKIKSGDLAVRKIGKRTLITTASIDAMLNIES